MASVLRFDCCFLSRQSTELIGNDLKILEQNEVLNISEISLYVEVVPLAFPIIRENASYVPPRS